MRNIKTKFSVAELLQIIEEAKNAELCHDLQATRRILAPVWEDLEHEPEFFDDIKPELKAEILRLGGFFLSNWGRAKNLPQYQERGKNLLTTAAEIFETENLSHKAVETRVMLALCYFYEGATEESEAILIQAEVEYAENQLHPVYLKICVNRLMCLYRSERFTEAFTLLEKMKVAMDFCKDERLLVKFHNQAGIIHRSLGKINEAFNHYKLAIQSSRRAKIPRYEAINLNNLAYLCNEIGDYIAAHLHTDRALKIFAKIEELGWTAHVHDTKATVYLLEGNLEEALNQINFALDIFRGGEDYSGLSDALFNRSRIQLKAGEIKSALFDLSEAIQIARQRTSEIAAERYADAFARLLYPIQNLDYAAEIRAFKKTLLTEAFRRNAFDHGKAAQDLGISHQNLSKILGQQFSELYDELGMERRHRTVAKEQRTIKLKKIHTETRRREIQILAVNHDDMTVPDSLKENLYGKFFSFVMSGVHLPELQTAADVVVLVTEIKTPENCRVVVQNRTTKKILCLNLDYDDFTRIHFLSDEGVPVETDDYTIYGKIAAYQLLEKVEGKIAFKLYETK